MQQIDVAIVSYNSLSTHCQIDINYYALFKFRNVD